MIKILGKLSEPLWKSTPKLNIEIVKLITDKIENDGIDDFHDSNLFKKSIDRIASSGYGPGLINAHRGVLTKIVKKFGSSELSSFTSTVSLVAIKASRSDATQFCRSVEIITD